MNTAYLRAWTNEGMESITLTREEVEAFVVGDCVLICDSCRVCPLTDYCGSDAEEDDITKWAIKELDRDSSRQKYKFYKKSVQRSEES
jgi:hypothetical protein